MTASKGRSGRVASVQSVVEAESRGEGERAPRSGPSGGPRRRRRGRTSRPAGRWSPDRAPATGPRRAVRRPPRPAGRCRPARPAPRDRVDGVGQPVQRADRNGELLGEGAGPSAADADLLPVLRTRAGGPAGSAGRCRRPAWCRPSPGGRPTRVDARRPPRPPCRPLVAEPHRVGGVALVQIGHLAGEELHVGAAHADPLHVDDGLARMPAIGRGTSCTSYLPGAVRTNARMVRELTAGPGPAGAGCRGRRCRVPSRRRAAARPAA